MKFSLPLQAHPHLLATYLATETSPSWQQFRDEHRDAYDELCSELNVRQRGLCAFCEIDLITSVFTQAREVEHWRPKSQDVPPNLERTFGVGNLQLGCLGGTNPYPTADIERTSNPPPGPNRSCGAKKGHNDPDNPADQILPYRPQDLPESPSMFSVDSEGSLRPILDSSAFGIETARLWATIDFLGLNCTRLKNARREINKYLDTMLEEYIASVPQLSEDDQIDTALILLAKDLDLCSSGNLPRFVTTIRFYFGRAFDDVLFPVRGWSIGK